MKTITKALIAGGLAILVIIGFPLIRFVYEMAIWSYDDNKQMAADKKYMDSLTDKDIQAWIQRTQTILKKDNPKDFTTTDAPPDLQLLGMTGIEENSNYIDFMWLGGMDYTALEVERISNEDFQVTAIYTPYSNRVIWPKQ